MMIAQLIDGMKFAIYTHISVRRYNSRFGIDYLGGGCPDDIRRRFGKQEIVKSMILDDVLILYVE